MFSRYITVCKPLYRRKTKIKANYFMIPITFFAILYNMPRFYEFRFNYDKNTCTDLSLDNGIFLEENNHADYKNNGSNGDFAKCSNYWVSPTDLRKNYTYMLVISSKFRF